MLAGLQAELLRPETGSYISERLLAPLNDLVDQRPRQRAEIEQPKEAASQKLHKLIKAGEGSAGAPTVEAIRRPRERTARDGEVASRLPAYRTRSPPSNSPRDCPSRQGPPSQTSEVWLSIADIRRRRHSQSK
jgi:hypothetical protein